MAALPLFMFAGTSQALGHRLPADRVLARLEPNMPCSWSGCCRICGAPGPTPHILVRGESHFATPEVIDVIALPRVGRISSLASPAMPSCSARPLPSRRRGVSHHQRGARAQAHRQVPPTRSRLYEECVSAAGAWAQPWRIVLKAEGMSVGDTPRLVVTSIEAPTPQMLYDDLYGARGSLRQGSQGGGRMTSTATARRPPLPGQCACGFSWQVPPMASIMPSVRTPSSIPP